MKDPDDPTDPAVPIDLHRRCFLINAASRIAVGTVGISLYSLFGAEEAQAACNYTTGLTVEVRGDEAVVTRVASGSPAESAGLKVGDVILQWGDDTGACLSGRSTVLVARGEERLSFQLTPTYVAPVTQDTGGSSGRQVCSGCISCTVTCNLGCTFCTSCNINCTRCTSCTVCTSCTGCTRCTSGCTSSCTTCTRCMGCTGYRG